MQIAPAEPLVASGESQAVAWVALAEAHCYNGSESIMRMVRKTLARHHRIG